MKKLKNTPVVTVLLFVLAAALLLTGTIGGIRAARLIESPFYTANVGTQDIGVTLLENGEPVGWRDYGGVSNGVWNEKRGVLLANMLPEGEAVQPGVLYPEALSVKNTGKIDSFVRLTLYCYWVDGSGSKLLELDPSLILVKTLTDSGWVLDPSSSTEERTVLYYSRVLPVGASTPVCTENLSIDPKVLRLAETGADGTVRFLYEGVEFRVEAEVDAVQTHNAQDAIWSAWGRRVTVNGDALTLS